jgi:hypothetical protein
MKKFRLISIKGDGLVLMQRLAAEGYTVDVWTKEPIECDLPRPLAWNHHLTPDMVIFFDYYGAGPLADMLTKNGFSVYGTGKLNDSFETAFGRRLATLSGLKVPRQETCRTFNEALELVESQPDLWFMPQKPNQKDFLLQERIPGIEFVIERYYYKGDPIVNSLNSRLEIDRNVAVRFWKKAEPKLYKLTLARIEPFLVRFQYSGPLTCKVVINKDNKQPYFVGWSAGFAFKGLAGFCEGLNQSLAHFVTGILEKATDKPKRTYSWFYCNGQAKLPEKPVQDRICKTLAPQMNKLKEWKYL